MLIKDSKYDARHTVNIPPDDGKEITFLWHFPRGTLSKRMSGIELADFLMGHMPHVLPLLGGPGNERIQAHFAAMLVSLITTPREKLDELIPWIQSVVRQQDDDIIKLSFYSVPETTTKVYFT